MERTVSGNTLTLEMNNFIDAVLAGLNVKGEAFAGTGKSSTLRAIEKYHTDKQGCYICFNKTLEMDARKLFAGHSVDIITSNALALRSFSREHQQRFLNYLGKLSYDDFIKYSKWDDDGELETLFTIEKSFNLVLATANHYINSASVELSHIHVDEKLVAYLSKLRTKKIINKVQEQQLLETCIKAATNLAKAMLSLKSTCPTTHDAYVKKWQLSKPQLNYDYIMFDEAQDANAVMLSVILNQNCQQIFVGDRYQSLYQFRGSINAMDLIPYETFPLSNSFRFGQRVAELANKVLHHHNPNVNITGKGFDTEVIRGSEYNGTEPLLFISNTNAALFDVLITGYENNVPMCFIGNKVKSYSVVVDSLLSLKLANKPKLPAHKRFKDFNGFKATARDAESKYFATLLDEDTDKAQTLLSAFNWCVQFSEKTAKFVLTTTHLSKGLEYDHVMLCDDFKSAISAFQDGKPLAESDLYSLYVAITRPKKTLVIPDVLFEALEENLAFSLNKTAVPPRLLDNVLPETSVEPGEPETTDTPEPESSSLESCSEENTPEAATKTPQKPCKSIKAQSPQKVTSSLVNSAQLETADSQSICINVGHAKTDNTPLYWTPTNTEHFFNPNIGVLGTMGTGKTQTVKSMITQLKRQESLNTDGEKFGVLIFDYKNDYTDKEFLTATGATVLEANNLPINPFALFTKDKLAPVHTARTFISTLAKIYRLGPKQEQMLKNCIDLAYEKKGIERGQPKTFTMPAPTLRDVNAIYNSQDKVPSDSLMSALSDLYDYEIFESNPRKCQNLFEKLDGNIVVVKLSGTDAKLQSLIVAVLLDIFYIQMHQAGKPKPKGSHRALKKLVLVDEADNFMSQDFPALRKILKEGREFGCGCLLSTQGLDHFKTAENSYSDYMCGWIVHRLNNPNAKQVELLLNTDSKNELSARVKELGELEKHHALFVDGRKHIVHQESTAFWKLVANS
ncbi:helicase HerA domain-containing protein [Photobacterium leiognathi]|uniref:helicase HerA domain-containing protein n=1 Tax=Photobacterium leiognathi TaxID=553611 RepID=UPI00298176D6|nr:DUF87 domain-containing protein [Photobacterium leiognathi]